MAELFHALIWVHIAIGAVGLLTFWVPVLARKGGMAHIRWGRIFIWCMLVNGALAVAISGITLLQPGPTHPKIPDMRLVRGIFGWMMMYLGVLTVNLAWYGWMCVLNRRDHARNLALPNLALQAAVTLAALNCAVEGWLIGQPLMIGISTIGFATAATNLRFMLRRKPAPGDWQYEHLKGLVGAGISVYTAFFAFGAVRTIPELALNPWFWSVPLIVGLGIIIYHWLRLGWLGLVRR